MQSGGTAIDQLGVTQQRILRELLRRSRGSDVDQLAADLAMTKSGMRQHLIGLERDGLVVRSGLKKTERRPRHLYQLSASGRELFPRHYIQMAELLIESVRASAGETGLLKLMQTMGEQAASQFMDPRSGKNEVEILADAMCGLGYDAQLIAADEIKAFNCVFHHLAALYPQVCEFDLALMRHATGRQVEHQECMVRGGDVCRFKFGKKFAE